MVKIGCIYWNGDEGSIKFNDELDKLNAAELLDLATDCITVFRGIDKEGFRKLHEAAALLAVKAERDD
tara:strand:+ start:382 stop:585 length:204 start_codon:yes stop_codon:yes gene_type:complete